MWEAHQQCANPALSATLASCPKVGLIEFENYRTQTTSTCFDQQHEVHVMHRRGLQSELEGRKGVCGEGGGGGREGGGGAGKEEGTEGGDGKVGKGFGMKSGWIPGMCMFGLTVRELCRKHFSQIKAEAKGRRKRWKNANKTYIIGEGMKKMEEH